MAELTPILALKGFGATEEHVYPLTDSFEQCRVSTTGSRRYFIRQNAVVL
jgi:hypothetical protein